MSWRAQAAETRAILAAAWDALPPALRLPTQFLGRQYAGCGATIGAMPRCDFTCSGCYLGHDANHARPLGLADLDAQLDRLRAWLGPSGNLQITDGEVTLRDERELIRLIRRAREVGLVPMLMTHGETFRRKPRMLDRLMADGGLGEVCFHVDTTMRGRRDRFARARTEADLHALRAEFADLIRAARARTGLPLDAASTVTVSRSNLDDVPGIVRWFLDHADAFKMVSFQPLTAVGRTDPALAGVDVEALWRRIADGAGEPELAQGTGHLGHPACSRFVQGVAVRRGGRVRFAPLYRQDRPAEMRFLDELLARLGGTSFRLEHPAARRRHATALLARHAGFLVRRGLPQLWRVARRAGLGRPRYFCVVSHHFMNAAELATPVGRERLAACAFRVPVDGRLESMCAVNALGLRETVYRDAAGARA